MSHDDKFFVVTIIIFNNSFEIKDIHVGINKTLIPNVNI